VSTDAAQEGGVGPSSPPDRKRNRARTPALGESLGSPPFRSLLASSSTSTLGAAVSVVSVNWIVYHFTHSAIDITYLGLTGILPGIVLGLFAGVVADRYNRRSLMVTADLTRTAGMGLLTAVLYLSGFSLPWILGVMILVNSFSALFTPASQAIVPQLVAKRALEDANGLLYSISGVAWSVGSAAGGVAVVLFGALWGLGLNALTYALSAIFLLQIAGELGRSVGTQREARGSIRRDLSEGVGYVLNHRSIFEVSFGYLPSNFLSAFVSPFFVVYAATRFGGSAAAYGYLVAALAAGTAVGSLIVGRAPARRVAGLVMGACLLAEGAAYGILAISANLEVSVAAVLGAGLAIGFSNTVYYSTIQAVVPREMLGRVMSIGDFGSFAAIPAGLVAGGLLISRFGVEPTILAASVGILATATFLLSLREFRSFGER
jgi:MFS family permease